MVGKDKPKFHTSCQMTATTFLLIAIITTGTLFAFQLVFSRSHIAMAQQQQHGATATTAATITA